MASSSSTSPDPGVDLLQPELTEPESEAGSSPSTEAVTALTPLQQRIGRRTQRTPEWLGAFLAGNSREKNRFKREMATIRGSVVWLVRQRRLGRWNPEDRAHLRQVMRSASSVSPYLIIWVVPGSMLLLPFMAWFIDMRRKGRQTPGFADHDHP